MAIREVKNDNVIVTYVDVHLFGPHQLWTPDEFVKMINDDLKNNEIVILLGDIIDLANCKKSEVDDALDLMTRLQSMVELYIHGNHELMISDDNYGLIGHDTIVAHGDWEWWGAAKTRGYRAQKFGAGFMKRAWAKRFDNLRKYHSVKPTKKFIKNLEKIDRSVYYCGHKHPEKTVKFLVGNKQVICLSRGRHEIIA